MTNSRHFACSLQFFKIQIAGLQFSADKWQFKLLANIFQSGKIFVSFWIKFR